jgi:glutathione reductase (NADPH)
MDSYDLIVIGTGTAAQVVSSRVRCAGRSVAIIDHRPFGGTCALRGCDPKKMLISGAEAADWARRMHRRGVVGELSIEWKELIAFKRTFTDPVPKKLEESFTKQGIDAFHGVHGVARFEGPDTIVVEGRALKGRNIVIAAGARPVRSTFRVRSLPSPARRSWSSRICPSGSSWSAVAISRLSSRTSPRARVRR